MAHREGLFSQGAVFMVQTFAVLLSVGLAARWLDRRALEGLGLRLERGFYRDVIFGTALGGLLMGGIALSEVGLGLATYEVAPELSGEVPRLAYLPMALYVFVAVAIIEEVVFRGYHLTNLAEGLTCRWLDPKSATVLAVILSSFAFGLAHAGNPHASAISSGNIVLAGAMLALGYLLTGNLAIPIGLHLGWNFFQNLLDMPVSGQTFYAYGAVVEREVHGEAWITGGEFGPEAGLSGLVAMAIGTALIVLYVRLRHGPLRVDGRLGRYVRLS